MFLVKTEVGLCVEGKKRSGSNSQLLSTAILVSGKAIVFEDAVQAQGFRNKTDCGPSSFLCCVCWSAKVNDHSGLLQLKSYFRSSNNLYDCLTCNKYIR